MRSLDTLIIVTNIQFINSVFSLQIVSPCHYISPVSRILMRKEVTSLRVTHFRNYTMKMFVKQGMNTHFFPNKAEFVNVVCTTKLTTMTYSIIWMSKGQYISFYIRPLYQYFGSVLIYRWRTLWYDINFFFLYILSIKLSH